MSGLADSGADPPSELSELIRLGKMGVLTSSQLDQLLLHQVRMDRGRLFLDWAGIVSGWTIAIAFLIVSAVVIMSGHEVGGTVLGTVDLVGLVTVFVLYGSRAKQ